MIDLNPNCSEATVRLRTDKLSNEEYKALVDVIKEWESSEDWCDDTWWSEECIFGVSHIKIKGNFPYNNFNDIDSKLYNIPFGDKVEVEYEE